MALKGRLDLAQLQITSDLSLDHIDLPALQELAPSVLAARLTAGQLSAEAHVQTSFAAANSTCTRSLRPCRSIRLSYRPPANRKRR